MSSENNAPLNSSALDRLLQGTRSSGTGATAFRYRRRAIALAAIWFFCCLAWGAPAALMALLLKPLAPQLELQMIEGSFWHGRAGAAFWQQGSQRFALGNLEWRLSPWSLLWLHPGAHITANYGDQVIDTRVRVSPLGTLQLRDLRAALPVEGLSQKLPLRLDGLLGLRFARAEIARRDPQLRVLEGDFEWQRAASQWNSNWVALGDYSGRISMPEKEQLRIQLDGKGALAATGEATVKLADKSYALQLLLTPAPTLPQELRDGAGAMLGGQRDAQGRWQIKRDGKW
jgi:hypothetical protein